MRLRPQRSDSQPKGDLQDRLGQPVGTERNADQGVVAAARKVLGVQREHRKNDEHPEHAQAKNAGQSEACAQLGGGHRASWEHPAGARERARWEKSVCSSILAGCL